MSQVQSVGTQQVGSSDVRLSIARASQATGVDFDYLLAQARLESSLNPHARAGTSSAAGLYQFIGSTWLETLDRHGANHGFGWADSAISGGRVVDPSMRAEIMSLRYDPNAASLMAAELARDNQAELRQTLGREPDHAELYLAHFMGSGGASRFLTAMAGNPDTSAAALFPKQAAANRPVFFHPSGASRSLGEVMDHFRTRLGNAMAQEAGGIPPATMIAMAGRSQGARAAATPPSNLGPLGQEFHSAANGHSMANPGGQGRVSMVETLQQTFAGTGNGPGAMPEQVRSAYAKLKAYNL